MQRVYKPALEGEFYKMLTALVNHFRHQVNLISEMKTTCPKVSDVRWISIDSVSTWLVAIGLECKETILHTQHCLVDLPPYIAGVC
jgi:hypothetical protein